MRFWWVLFVCNMTYSVAVIIIGLIMWKHCPHNYNSIFGYRSSLSTLNIETWKFANTDCGKRRWKIGWVMFVAMALVQLPFYGSSEKRIALLAMAIAFIECSVIVHSAFLTERALKKNFTADGEKIDPEHK